MVHLLEPIQIPSIIVAVVVVVVGVVGVVDVDDTGLVPMFGVLFFCEEEA